MTGNMAQARKVLVTGAEGLIGRNLVVALRRVDGIEVMTFDVRDQRAMLDEYLDKADVICHLAGANRQPDTGECEEANAGLTQDMVDFLSKAGRKPTIVFTSSTQAALDNPCGRSMHKAEAVLQSYADGTGASVVIFRLPDAFGKWCPPNRNSVVATFCHNVAHDLEVTVSDPDREIELVYVDDVVKELVKRVTGDNRAVTSDELRVTSDKATGDGVTWGKVTPVYRVTLGKLSEVICGFRESRRTLRVPDFSNRFTKNLYATYLSYLDSSDFAYALEQKTDARGALAEFFKTQSFGLIFVSRTKTGVTRGNHYHNTKTEKFAVLEGEAIVRFRNVTSDEVIEYKVTGREFKVVDIPPGYVHSIENVGTTELITLFWVCEPFDPNAPDGYPESVLKTNHK